MKKNVSKLKKKIKNNHKIVEEKKIKKNQKIGASSL